MNNSILTESFLKSLVDLALTNNEGRVATYIPELANIDDAITAIAVQMIGCSPIVYSNLPMQPITLQSTAKLVPLIAHLEEHGPEQQPGGTAHHHRRRAGGGQGDEAL